MDGPDLRQAKQDLIFEDIGHRQREMRRAQGLLRAFSEGRWLLSAQQMDLPGFADIRGSTAETRSLRSVRPFDTRIARWPRVDGPKSGHLTKTTGP